MASAYLVQVAQNSNPGRTLRNGVDSLVVYAASTTAAKQLAKSILKANGDSQWDSATVTALAAGTDWKTPVPWTIRIRVTTALGADIVDISYDTSAGTATVDAIAAALVTLLNATTPIAGAAYNSSTNVMKVAETTDALGDCTVTLLLYPTGGDPGFVSGGLFGAIVHQGSSGAALTITLGADAVAVPVVLAKLFDVGAL